MCFEHKGKGVMIGDPSPQAPNTHIPQAPVGRLICGHGRMENKMETTVVYWGYIGIMEKKMETTVVYWGYIGIMEMKMETTIFAWFEENFQIVVSSLARSESSSTRSDNTDYRDVC